MEIKVKEIARRFTDIAKIYRGNLSHIGKIQYFLDYLGAFIIHGASFNDYFGYGFDALNYKGRGKYITLRRTRKLQSICNDKDYIKEFRDKIYFNTLYSKYLGRRWLDVSNASFDQFETFIKEIGDKVFIKDVLGLCGIGVECIRPSEYSLPELYGRLINDTKAKYLIEEPIIQEGVISELHPWSVNTIRVTTIYNQEEDVVNIMGAVLRMGTGKDHRDNLHAGGIAAHIDVESGVIFKPGFDKTNHEYIYHPDTNKQIVGFVIPEWNNCKEFICEVARKNKKVRYVGWDVVVKGDGTFLLIEGNDNGDHDVQQLFYKGLWPAYKKILNNLK